MNGSVTMGDYQPGTSVLHRLDARVKIVLLCVACASLLGVQNLAGLVGIFALGTAGLIALRVNVASHAKGLGALIVAFLVIALANALRTDGSADWTLWGSVGLSLGGLEEGIAVCVRVLAMASFALLVSATTSIEQMGSALESLLLPLAKLRVPTNDLALGLTLALRFIPLTVEQLDRVVLAQRSRGAHIGQGNPFRRVLSWLPVFIPLVVGLFRRADEVAQAMRARGYHGQKRTRLYERTLTFYDLAVLICGIALSILMAILL